MKKIIYILSFLLNSFFSYAQSDSVPAGNVRIVLQSGRNIKSEELRSVSKTKIEFVKEGNLCDEKTEKVQFIETNSYLIWFDENQNRYNRPYDFLILLNGDSLRGSIQKENSFSIAYMPFGSDHSKIIEKSSLKNQEKKEVLTETKPPKTELAKPTPKKPNMSSLWASIFVTGALTTIIGTIVIIQNNPMNELIY